MHLWFLTALVTITVGLVGWEVWARRVIRRLHADFQWLITEQDEAPELDAQGMSKFLVNGYDPKLGWVRKPNTSGTEQSRDGIVHWWIDHMGARRDPYMEGSPTRVVTVGDSYTFARQVADGEAWSALLGQLLGVRVVNFGVGNYGLDQAVLRYRREGRIPGAKVAILGVVPETIVRIHSAWKHYSEYGNTFAFKPRFRLRDNELELLPNIIDSPDRFMWYREFLPILQKRDYFYKSKFRRDMIRTPYLWHWLVKPRNRRLVALLQERERRRANGICDKVCEAAPFRSVLERNLRLAGEMYGKAECRALFKALVLLFARDARVAGADPMFVMFPQLLDLECFGDEQPYRSLLDELGKFLLVVDATEALADADASELYMDDAYGGHYSAEGNGVIAKLIARHVVPLLQREESWVESRRMCD